MAANTYAFDVTAAEVKAEQLDFMQTFNTGLMDSAIDRAASELNVALRMMNITPTSITSAAATVDDYNWCRSTVIVGAAGYYIGLSTGAWPAASDRLSAMDQRIREFKSAPQMLTVYDPSASSTATARSRANYMPGPVVDEVTASARARFLQPSDRFRWRQ